MRVSTRIVALVLCSLLFTGLAFAGGGDEEASAPASKATGVQLPESEIFAKYTPEVTITFGGRENVGVTYPDGENMENNPKGKHLEAIS